MHGADSAPRRGWPMLWLARAAGAVYSFFALVGLFYVVGDYASRSEVMFVAAGGAIGVQVALGYVEWRNWRRQRLAR